MTSISKTVYTDKLDEVVNKHNNTYHRSIKMKPVDVKSITYINCNKKINDKDPKFEVGDHVRISKYKNIFAKGCVPHWSEEVFVITKVKNTVLWTYVISDLTKEEIVGTFFEKELQKTNQKEFRVAKVIKRKGYNNSFNSWIDKKDSMSGFFAKRKSFGGRVKVELDLSNYVTKADLKHAKGVNTSKFAKKVDLVSLISNVDKLDIDKLKNVPSNLRNLKSKVDNLDVDKLVPVPVNLSKLSDVVKNDVVKKDVYNA